MPTPKKRTITAEDLYKFELISEVRLSPNGQQVIYSQQRVDQKTEKKYSNLWIVPTSGGEPRQYTYGDQNDARPRWSPDGSQIAFLSNRGNKEKPPQIYIIPFQGGEARPLTEIKGQIGGFVWSPDGKQLLCSVRKTDAEVLEREKDEQKKKLGTVVRHYDRLHYKLDGFGYLPKERTHIWTVNVRTGKTKQLTDHSVYDEQLPSWSPDGKTIAFISNRSAEPDLSPDLNDLYTMPARGGELRKLETPAGMKMHPRFSPDGKWIAYFGTEGEGEGWRNIGLWVLPADGSQAPENLTARYDFHVSADVINDLGSPDGMPPIWSNDSQRLYFPVAYHGSSLYKSISINGEDLQTVIDEGGTAGSITFDKNQDCMAYFYGMMDDPGQVYVLQLSTGAKKQLTQINKELLNSLDLGRVETVWIKGKDGNDIQGWIMTPPSFDPSKKYPSILEIHGGPMTQYGNLFMHEFYYLAAQGYVVHFSNPRGGRGYGEEHGRAIWGQFGSVDYDDVMSWTDYVAQQPYIDPARMGVTGGSYGGYMTTWIIGHTQRFKAAVAQRVVSNWVSMWGSSDMNWVFQRWLGDKAPFEDINMAWDQSPMKYIGNAKIPTLVIHSENDMRCPIEQGEQVFVALKKLGVDTEFVRFPDEPHGLSRVGRTDRRIARLNHILRWFDKYLKP